VLSAAKANTNDTDADANNGGPERKEEQQARTDWIGIWIGPQTNRSSDDDEQ